MRERFGSPPSERASPRERCYFETTISTGPGAGLNRQVLAGLHRAVHGFGHRDLSGPLHSPDARDRGREQRCDVRQAPLTGFFTLAALAGILGNVSARLIAHTSRLTAGVIRARLAAGIVCGALARMAGGHVKKRYRAWPLNRACEAAASG